MLVCTHMCMCVCVLVVGEKALRVAGDESNQNTRRVFSKYVYLFLEALFSTSKLYTWASQILISTGAPGINPQRITRDKCIYKLQGKSQGEGRESGEEKIFPAHHLIPSVFHSISYWLSAWPPKLSDLKSNNAQVVPRRRISPSGIFISYRISFTLKIRKYVWLGIWERIPIYSGQYL